MQSVDLMGIHCTTPVEQFHLYQKVAKIVSEETIRALAYLGEKSVVRIRDREAEESWIDHTGNLRSSIGYAVYERGKKVIESTFQTVLNGADGTKEGQKYVDRLASQYAQTYALVVVAGMNYAEYVEAIEGKDVLASTELWAKAKVSEYMSKAKERAEKRINILLK